MSSREHDLDQDQPPEPDAPESSHGPLSRSELAYRVVMALVFLYAFLIGVGMLEDGIAQMGEGFHEGILEGVRNPIAGLLAGILATIVVQSSSVSTSTIVGLVAAGVVPVEVAVPMVMGANIGTTVTNSLITVASIRRREEFGRVFAAATMHDMFNFFAVLLLLPLELATGFLAASARWLAEQLASIGIGGAEVDSPIQMATDPANELVEAGLGTVLPEGTALGIVMLVGGIAVLYLTLRMITQNLKVVLTGPIQKRMNSSVSRAGGLVGVGVGAIAAVLAVTSTIVTVSLIPLVAVGAITVRNAYPVTIGANLGTTLTAQLAALATGQPEALVIALVHLMFNVTAVAIIYPIPRIRYIPLRIAERLGQMAAKRRWVMPTYVGSVFVALPVAGVALG